MVAGWSLALCVVGAGGLGVFSFQSVWGASGPVRDTADGFLHEVAGGDPGAAYDRLCTESRSRWSRDGFSQWLRTPPLVTGYEITDVSVATRRGRPRGEVSFRLDRQFGLSDARKLPVVREDGHWRICGDLW